jgi:hypothetical protein
LTVVTLCSKQTWSKLHGANMVHQHMSKAKIKLSRIKITARQSKLLPLRRRRKIRRMMIVSCADLLIIE